MNEVNQSNSTNANENTIGPGLFNTVNCDNRYRVNLLPLTIKPKSHKALKLIQKEDRNYLKVLHENELRTFKSRPVRH